MGVIGPTPYPRIPYLTVHASLSGDDLVLDAAARQQWLGERVLVEEKLDGANVCLWLGADGSVQSAGRSGAGGRDRAQQFGRLRAWVAERSELLRPLLRQGRIVYGEWLYLRHTIAYNRLPDYFVGLDVRQSNGDFLSSRERDAELGSAGLVAPPPLFAGRLETLDRLLNLLSGSAFGADPPEGAVLRSLEGRRSLVKFVHPDFRRLSDDDWRRGRPENGLRPR